jgi:aryl-alcohol dehydrogenase-like predicted oxidoreductase
MHRSLGRSGLSIFPLVLGGNVFGWTIDEPTSFAVLDAYVAGGGNIIDTADVYSAWAPGNAGGGQSETIIGKWLRQRGRRDDVLIATKVGYEIDAQHKGLAKDYIRRSVENSLRRLQTDYIDLYQSHKDDATVPVTEPLEAYDQLMREGKVRVIGASNFTAGRLQEALAASRQHNLPRYETLQNQYNLYDRADYEQNLVPLLLRENIGGIPFYGLARGFLTGKYRTAADLQKSVRGTNIGQSYLNEKGQRLLHALDAVADHQQATPAQIALAWLMQAPGVTAPIASATSPGQVAELLEAAALRLTAEDVHTLQQTQD